MSAIYNQFRVMHMLTLSKLAKLANVSVSTASKAFSMSSEVSEETRALVFDIAKQYGCFKKFFKGKYPNYVVAVICPEFTSLHYARYLSYLQRELERKNCEVCVAATNFSAETGRNLIEYYYKYSTVDGIIMVDFRGDIPECGDFPIVCLNSPRQNSGGATIRIDQCRAISDAVAFLLSRKVSSIGFIGETLTEAKLDMFRQVTEEMGIHLREDWVSISDQRFEKGGYSAMGKLIDRGSLPRAVICAYDYMAIGAIRCLCDHGLRVPEDVAVVGMDDIPEAAYLNPPLASIASHTDRACCLAADAIIRLICGETPGEHQTVCSDFIPRRSCEPNSSNGRE